MRYETVQNLSEGDFKRATGVRRATFNKTLEILQQREGSMGRPPKLIMADQLLMTLMYWREYRAEFHIGLTYGVSETAFSRTIPKVENKLIKSEQFHLPGKKVNKGRVQFIVYNLAVGTYYNALCQDLQERRTMFPLSYLT